MRKIKLGTRGSKLALVQAAEVAEKIGNCEIISIKTTGDIITDKPLADIGGKALFLKEIEEKLLLGEIDIAVHSLKDMPPILPDSIALAAITKRRSSFDVLISNKYKSIDEILRSDDEITIGTCSVRRKALLRHLFIKKNNIKFVDLRGNIETRIGKMDDGVVDCIILAEAGLQRTNLIDKISAVISPAIMLPAIGQGALGIECRNDDVEMIEILKKVNHLETQVCAEAERNFMFAMGGNCHTPIAAHATLNNNEISLEALFAMPDGSEIFCIKLQGNIDDKNIGLIAAEKIKSLIKDSKFYNAAKEFLVF